MKLQKHRLLEKADFHLLRRLAGGPRAGWHRHIEQPSFGFEIGISGVIPTFHKDILPPNKGGWGSSNRDTAPAWPYLGDGLLTLGGGRGLGIEVSGPGLGMGISSSLTLVASIVSPMSCRIHRPSGQDLGLI